MSEGEFYFPLWYLDFGAAASADESHIPAEPRKTWIQLSGQSNYIKPASHYKLFWC